MNNLPKVVAQQRRGRALNLDRKSDALPLSHRATHVCSDLEANIGGNSLLYIIGRRAWCLWVWASYDIVFSRDTLHALVVYATRLCPSVTR